MKGLSQEFAWQVIIGQEVTKAKGFPDQVGGHRIVAAPPRGGCRTAAIFISETWSHYEVGEPFFYGDSMGLEIMHPVGGSIFVISARLSANTVRADYADSIRDFQACLGHVRYDSMLLCGINFQHGVERFGKSFDWYSHRHYFTGSCMEG